MKIRNCLKKPSKPNREGGGKGKKDGRPARWRKKRNRSAWSLGTCAQRGAPKHHRNHRHLPSCREGERGKEVSPSGGKKLFRLTGPKWERGRWATDWRPISSRKGGKGGGRGAVPGKKKCRLNTWPKGRTSQNYCKLLQETLGGPFCSQTNLISQGGRGGELVH